MIGVFTEIRDWIELRLNEAVTIVTTLFERVRDFVSGNLAEILSIVAIFLTGPAGLVVLFSTNAFGIRDAVTGAFGEMVGYVSGIPGALLGVLSGGFEAVLSWASGLPEQLATRISGGLWRLYDIGRQAAERIVDGILSVDIPNPLDAIGGIAGSIGLQTGLWNVPGPRGAGDIFPARLAPGEMVIPAAAADRIRAGGGGLGATSLVVNFNGPIMGDRIQAERMADAMLDIIVARGRTFPR